MKMRFRVGIASFLMLAATAAEAQSAGTGWYIGLGAGTSNFSDSVPKQIRNAYVGNTFYRVTAASTTDDSDTAAQLFVGYRFLPWLGVEAGYQRLGEATTHYALQAIDSPPIKPTIDGRYSAHAFDAALVASLPLGDRFELLARGGIADVRLNYSETGTNQHDLPYFFRAPHVDDTKVQIGVGALWRFAPAFALRLDLDRTLDVGKKFAFQDDTSGRFDHIDAYTLNFVWTPGGGR